MENKQLIIDLRTTAKVLKDSYGMKNVAKLLNEAADKLWIEMDDDKVYITYPNADKINIMDIDDPILLDEMVEITEKSDINLIKAEIKNKVDEISKMLMENRGPIKDCLVRVSGHNFGEVTTVMGPVYDEIEDYNSKRKYIRYARSVEFI